MSEGKMSKRTVLVVAMVAIVLVVAGLWVWRARQGALEAGAIDLIDGFPDAEKRTTMASLAEGYAIESVSIDGDRKRSIFAHPFSRITWSVAIPPRAVLRTAAALRPDVWGSPGDGALFRIGISDGATYTEFYKQMIQPFDVPADRRWFPVEVDLSAYAGRTVKVIFNTEPGDAANAVADACIWGAPRIVPGEAAGTRESP
jgi:hypothetical protein